MPLIPRSNANPAVNGDRTQPFQTASRDQATVAEVQIALRDHVDWAQLRSLSDGNLAFELELLTIFLHECEIKLEPLKVAIAERNLLTTERIAHYIKGSSVTVGATIVGNSAATLENQAREGYLLSPEAELAVLETSLAAIRQSVMGDRPLA